MTEQLRDAMTRLADATPPVVVDPTVWDRGRRARRHDRIAGGVVALALVACLAGLGGLLVSTPAPVTPADGPGSEGAVPSRIWGVPARLMDHDAGGFVGASWRPSVAVIDLAVGRASVAFTAGHSGELAVVVTARDGAYHPLALPGFAGEVAGMVLDGSALALSPDGTRLAYAYARPAAGREDYSRVPSGIRVVDLTTGDVREIGLDAVTGSDAQATVAGRLVWSPDGRWLAWAGRRFQQLNASGTGSRGPGVAGIVAPGSRESRPLPTDFADHPLAVTAAGVVVSGERGRFVAWDDGRVRPIGHDLLRGSAQEAVGAASPDGRHVLLPRSLPATTVPVLDVRTGRVRPVALPPEVGKVVAEPIGWVDDELMVVEVRTTFDESRSGWSSDPPLIALLPGPGAQGGGYRVVSGWASDDIPAPAHLSVAVDLMSAEAPVRTFPEPEWPWSDERRALVAGLVLCGLALAAYGIVLLVRRRR